MCQEAPLSPSTQQGECLTMSTQQTSVCSTRNTLAQDHKRSWLSLFTKQEWQGQEQPDTSVQRPVCQPAMVQPRRWLPWSVSPFPVAQGLPGLAALPSIWNPAAPTVAATGLAPPCPTAALMTGPGCPWGAGQANAGSFFHCLCSGVGSR